MWLCRLSRFEDNPYYTGDVYQGEVALPNCTTYAKLRETEMCELTEPHSIFVGRSATGFPTAKYWYDQTTLPKGTELKEGSIAVFNGNEGHVAVVEKKISDTRAIISQSQYDSDKSRRDYKYFETREVDLIVGQRTIQGVGELIGFIYPPIKDKRCAGNLEITEDYVNARKEPNGELVSKGLYIPMGYYNVLDTYNDGTYEWYKLDTNVWVRQGSWTRVVNDYKLKYESLLNDIKEVIKKYE